MKTIQSWIGERANGNESRGLLNDRMIGKPSESCASASSLSGGLWIFLWFGYFGTATRGWREDEDPVITIIVLKSRFVRCFDGIKFIVNHHVGWNIVVRIQSRGHMERVVLEWRFMPRMMVITPRIIIEFSWWCLLDHNDDEDRVGSGYVIIRGWEN